MPYIWIAQAGACEDCEAMDGVMVEEQWEFGVEPGTVHPHCACISDWIEWESYFNAGGATPSSEIPEITPFYEQSAAYIPLTPIIQAEIYLEDLDLLMNSFLLGGLLMYEPEEVE